MHAWRVAFFFDSHGFLESTRHRWNAAVGGLEHVCRHKKAMHQDCASCGDSFAGEREMPVKCYSGLLPGACVLTGESYAPLCRYWEVATLKIEVLDRGLVGRAFLFSWFVVAGWSVALEELCMEQ
ncbi:uncharacterized protein [Lolium perenne]|uniref:uncharacterized protein isoform X3 n=1 Tax=Lolium perenne TaxID=4522 RepID=UPI003A99259E